MVPGNFGPPWSGVWCLTGEVIQNQKEEFEFRCDDSVMGNRGGTYHFKLLTMKNTGSTDAVGMRTMRRF